MYEEDYSGRFNLPPSSKVLDFASTSSVFSWKIRIRTSRSIPPGKRRHSLPAVLYNLK
ncbi:MAG: hypothetical protein LUQ59_00635 [Methanothrix sp.]|nr:hypothetical protein [Methanothrix sp.]